MSTTRIAAGNGRRAVWTREAIVEALREYAARYEQPTTAAFNPSTAKWRDAPELVDRYYAGREDGTPWPSLNCIKSHFDGSFNDALEAAGLPRNRPGPGIRRAAGMHRPLREFRERRVFVTDERLQRAHRETRLAEERAARATHRATRLTDEIAELRARRSAAPVRERVVPAPPPRVAPRVITKTKTKTVKVRDERAVERLRTQLEDERAARRAIADQLTSSERQHAKLKTELSNAKTVADTAAAEARSMRQDAAMASDRAVAAEARAERVADELAMARQELIVGAEAAAVSDAVQRAEGRAEAAEIRAARAEREAAEHAAVVTGELRRLTAEELKELKSNGPAGPGVLAVALKKLTYARQSGARQPLDAALTEVMRAARHWQERL